MSSTYKELQEEFREDMMNTGLIETNHETKSNNSDNNGGPTDYYKILDGMKSVQDIIEHTNMNFAQGNILKAAYCLNTLRHDGTTYERELNKIIYFAQRELNKMEQK